MIIHVSVIPVVLFQVCVMRMSIHVSVIQVGIQGIISGSCQVNEHSCIGYTSCYTLYYSRFMSDE